MKLINFSVVAVGLLSPILENFIRIKRIRSISPIFYVPKTPNGTYYYSIWMPDPLIWSCVMSSASYNVTTTIPYSILNNPSGSSNHTVNLPSASTTSQLLIARKGVFAAVNIFQALEIRLKVES